MRVVFRCIHSERCEEVMDDFRAGGLSHSRGSSHSFGPASVQLKNEISDAFARKRHQRRHLELCTTLLLSRMPQVRVLPGAPPC